MLWWRVCPTQILVLLLTMTTKGRTLPVRNISESSRNQNLRYSSGKINITTVSFTHVKPARQVKETKVQVASRVARMSTVSPSGTTSRYGPTLYDGKTWEEAGKAGLIFGYEEFVNQHHILGFREPTICENRYDFHWPNGSHNFVICPMTGQSDYHNHCCGRKYRKSCCCFWENERFLAGIVNGSAFMIGIVIFVAYCCRGKPLKVNRNSEAFIKYNAMFAGGRGPGYAGPIKPLRRNKNRNSGKKPTTQNSSSTRSASVQATGTASTLQASRL